MKKLKLICILMTVMLLFPSLVGCMGGNYTELVGDSIYCVVTAMDEKAGIDVEVCGDVFGKQSDKVKLVIDGLEEMNVAVGDELRVKVKKVNNSFVKGLTVYGDTAQVVALGDNHPSDGESPVYVEDGNEYGPYPILALSEITISPDFPTVQEMKDKSHEFEKRDGTHYVDLLRVVKIEEDIVYLSYIKTTQATFAIVGVPEVSFAVGDHVKLNKSICYGKDGLTILYLEDVTNFSVADEESIAREYYKENNVHFLKPVIYLYPEEDTLCSVKLNLDGKFTCTYPTYGTDGWQNFTAKPDGTLIFPDGSEYYCLYWEGRMDFNYDFSKGFCVKGSDTAAFLEKALREMGLTPREANEFIIYWLPQLQNNPYNLISFQGENYNAAAELEITPAPDSILRIYMVAKPLDAPVEIEPQTFAPFERNGFTVVEWGGSIIE